MSKRKRIRSRSGQKHHRQPAGGRGKAGASRGKPVVPVSPQLGTLLKETRIKKGLTQADLARQSGVSPSTIVKIEQRRPARFDAVVRLAHALGQPINAWLALAGHQDVQAERIAAIVKQQRAHEPEHFGRFEDPIEHFTQLRDELLTRQTPALACACFTSKPAALSRPELRQRLLALVKSGMHLALICPCPQPADIPPQYHTRKPSLVGFYTQVFGWVRQLAGELQRELPEEERSRVAMFVPSTGSRAGGGPGSEMRVMGLVPPPLLPTAYQPMFMTFRAGQSGQPERTELGAYVRSSGNRPDRWLVLHPREGEDEEQAEESRNLWQDFFGDILQAWQPSGSDTVWADDRLVDWTRV